jgi:hypothetical protein
VYGIALAFLIYHEEKELGDGFVWGILLIVASVVIQTLRVWKERKVLK